MFREVDYAYIGKRDGQLIGDITAAVKSHGLPHTFYERDAFLAKYPQFRIKENEVVLVNHSGGLVYPEKCIDAFL